MKQKNPVGIKIEKAPSPLGVWTGNIIFKDGLTGGPLAGHKLSVIKLNLSIVDGTSFINPHPFDSYQFSIERDH